jgi:hypothetical protein
VAALKFASQTGKLVATDYDSLYGQWSVTGFTYWAISRAMWDPAHFDRNTALLHYSSAAFGSQAATAGADYFNFWETWTNATFTRSSTRDAQAAGPGRKGGLLSVTRLVYTNRTLAHGQKLLDRVGAMCGTYLGCEERVQFFGLGVRHAGLTADALLAVAAASATQCYTSPHSLTQCDVRTALPAAAKLLAFRRQIMITGAINVLDVAYTEIQYAGCDLAGQALAAEASLLKAADDAHGIQLAPIAILAASGWRFAIDPTDVGARDGWYLPFYENASVWSSDGQTGSPWNRTQSVLAWSRTHANKTYSGVGWYRCTASTSYARGRVVLVSANATGNVTAYADGAPLRRLLMMPGAVQQASSSFGFDLRPVAGKPAVQLAIRVDGDGAGGGGLTARIWVAAVSGEALKSDDDNGKADNQSLASRQRLSARQELPWLFDGVGDVWVLHAKS